MKIRRPSNSLAFTLRRQGIAKPDRWLKLSALGLTLALAFLLHPLKVMAENEDGLTVESIEHARQLRDHALAGTRAFEWVESLTTEVGPRLAGSEAEARARDWAVSQLKQLGFSNVRVEPFDIEGWQRETELAWVVTPGHQPLAVTALGGSVSTPDGGIEAEVAYFANLQALEAAPAGSLQDKIAYVSHAMKRTQDGSHYGYFGRLRRTGASVAASKGAIGLLIRSIGTDSHRMPHTGALRYAPDQPKIAAAALSNPDADQLERLLARYPSVTVGLLVSTKFTGVVASGNVIAEIPGWQYPEQIVVMGGHLDSWDLGTGAIDDGAGVAISLEAARLILESGKRPRRTVRLIFWGAEEVGLLGGHAYRTAYSDSLDLHVVGSESDFGAGRIWRTSSYAPKAGPLIDTIEALLEPLGIMPGSRDQAGAGPDLTPMISAGMPSFRLHQDGRDYFDLHHTADDTLDKISAAELDQNVAAFLVFAWLAADSEISDWGWPR